MERDSLDDRVSLLEQRLADVIARLGPEPGGEPGTASAAETPAPTDVFWALRGLQARVPDTSGAVLFTGSVDLPTGEHYDWQYGTGVDDLMGSDWAPWADALAALGHPVRLLLLHRVLAGAHTTAELATDDGLGTTGQLYHHLRHLVSAGWLHSSSRGHYAVPGDRVVPLLVILSGVRR
jgi:hypothetical protein